MLISLFQEQEQPPKSHKHSVRDMCGPLGTNVLAYVTSWERPARSGLAKRPLPRLQRGPLGPLRGQLWDPMGP